MKKLNRTINETRISQEDIALITHAVKNPKAAVKLIKALAREINIKKFAWEDYKKYCNEGRK